MDSIMHYTSGPATLVATASFVIAFLVGIWVGGRFGKATIIPAILVSVAVVALRAVSPPLSVAAISAVSILHLTCGCGTALILQRAAGGAKRP